MVKIVVESNSTESIPIPNALIVFIFYYLIVRDLFINESNYKTDQIKAQGICCR